MAIWPKWGEASKPFFIKPSLYCVHADEQKISPVFKANIPLKNRNHPIFLKNQSSKNSFTKQ
jgi:hypothetical protein